MFQSDKKSTALGSILDPNIEINGNIDVTANLVIHGKVNGNVTSTQTLSTAKGSKIKGNIIAKTAMISGEVHGDLEVSEKNCFRPNCTSCWKFKSIHLDY